MANPGSFLSDRYSRKGVISSEGKVWMQDYLLFNLAGKNIYD
jgi:hypothetical protein